MPLEQERKEQDKIRLLEQQVQREVSLRKKLQDNLDSEKKEKAILAQELQALKSQLASSNHSSEHKYKTIIENMSLGLLEVDQDHKIQKAYVSFCKMLGYKAEELLGKNAADLFIPPEYHAILHQQQDFRKKGLPGVYEVEMIRKDGSRIWVLISGVPILDQQKRVIGSMGIHYDLTASKNLQLELEKAKQMAEDAQKAEKQFLANMSHEIRTPLNAIIGMTHLLYDTPISKEQSEFLDVLKSSADILQGLISDILDFSKIESGKLDLQKRPFDLKKLIHSLHKTFELKLAEQPVSIQSKLDPQLLTNLYGDDLLLKQVLLNLLGNACKFTSSGHIGIEVQVINTEEEVQLLRFCVADTGIGISEEDQRKIFQNYKQAKNDTRIQYGGTGLGLAITKQLVELQAGKIWVESEEGKGSRFFFEIPYQFISSNQMQPQSSAETTTEYYPKGQSILVVEDNFMNRKYVQSLLKKWDLNFDFAMDGVEATKRAHEKKYQLILMDLQMPTLDGYDACHYIRNHSNPNQHTPIIALTASAVLSDKKRAFDLGMNDFLAKPFTPDQLQACLNQYLQLHIGSEEKVIDTNMNYPYLADLYMDDQEYALEIFTLFLEHGLQDIHLLKDCFEKENWTGLQQVAHKLKPALSMVGYPHWGPLLERIEAAALTEKQAPIEKAFLVFYDNFILIRPKIEDTCSLLQAGDRDFFQEVSSQK